MLSHLGDIASHLVVIQVRVTDDNLLLRNKLHVTANFFQSLLIGGVPGALPQQVVCVFVGSLVSEWVHRDGRVIELCSEVVDRLEDLTTYLAHLVKRW